VLTCLSVGSEHYDKLWLKGPNKESDKWVPSLSTAMGFYAYEPELFDPPEGEVDHNCVWGDAPIVLFSPTVKVPTDVSVATRRSSQTKDSGARLTLKSQDIVYLKLGGACVAVTLALAYTPHLPPAGLSRSFAGDDSCLVPFLFAGVVDIYAATGTREHMMVENNQLSTDASLQRKRSARQLLLHEPMAILWFIDNTYFKASAADFCWPDNETTSRIQRIEESYSERYAQHLEVVQPSRTDKKGYPTVQVSLLKF